MSLCIATMTDEQRYKKATELVFSTNYACKCENFLLPLALGPLPGINGNRGKFCNVTSSRLKYRARDKKTLYASMHACMHRHIFKKQHRGTNLTNIFYFTTTGSLTNISERLRAINPLQYKMLSHVAITHILCGLID